MIGVPFPPPDQAARRQKNYRLAGSRAADLYDIGELADGINAFEIALRLSGCGAGAGPIWPRRLRCTALAD